MKFIKLFESFGITPESVLDDVKSIAYILEDDVYDISYEVKKYIVTMKVYLNQTEVRKSYLAPYGLSPYGDDYYRSKMVKDGDKFLSLLKEHLDYIPSQDIARIIDSSKFSKPLREWYYQISIFLPLKKS
jgi:hypothetical protein